jgi:hypothetical protein
MEHPFINDLSGKTLDELQHSITELTKNLTFAYRTGNSSLIQQLLMVLESYKKESAKRMDELYKKQNIQDRINISKDNK